MPEHRLWSNAQGHPPLGERVLEGEEGGLRDARAVQLIRGPGRILRTRVQDVAQIQTEMRQ